MQLKIPKYEGVDYSKPIIGVGNFTDLETPRDKHGFFHCNVDKSIVRQKFAMWDRVIDSGILLESYKGIKKHKYEAFQLQADKTIFAYQHFKFGGKPMKMRWYQDMLLSDDHDRILFGSSNQIGKSITLDVDSATEFMIDHGKDWVGILVSSSLDQSIYQMDRIKGMLKTAAVSYREEETTESKTGKRDTTKHITYTFYEDDKITPKYKNLLICCPPTSSALGYPADNLWLDEFDFWENIDQNHFIQQIAIPRTIETKGKIKIFSNPNGREKELYKLWGEKYSDGTPIWHRYNFNYWDKPGANQKEFDKLSARMNKFQKESTLLAVFGRTTGQFFSTEEIRDQIDPELNQKGDGAGYGRETGWFLDVGSVHDQSVLIGGFVEDNPENPEIPLIKAFWVHKYPVGYPLARVVGVPNAIKSNDGWADSEENNPSVKKVLDMYAEKEVNDKNEVINTFQPLFGFDITGNHGMLPLIQSVGIEAVDVTFTGRLKWEMYQRYQYYTQMRFLKRCLDRDENTVNGKDFTHQALKLIVTTPKNSSYRLIHHENEEDLDDTQDSIAGFIYLIENPDLPSLSFSIINNKGEMVTEEVIKEQKELKGQYIPGFYDKKELNDWLEQRQRERT